MPKVGRCDGIQFSSYSLPHINCALNVMCVWPQTLGDVTCKQTPRTRERVYEITVQILLHGHTTDTVLYIQLVN
jgi:hypothetical protein